MSRLNLETVVQLIITKKKVRASLSGMKWLHAHVYQPEETKLFSGRPYGGRGWYRCAAGLQVHYKAPMLPSVYDKKAHMSESEMMSRRGFCGHGKKAAAESDLRG